MAANLAAREAVWEREFLHELGWTQQTTRIHSDSQSAMALTKNATHHPKTKHIRRQWHYVRELIDAKEVELTFTGTDSQVADVLTKAVPKEKLDFCRSGMGVQDLTKVFNPISLNE
jgi:hypothetical protein